jgi:nucleoside-diphosphate-sugar epimerase
LSAQRTVLVAGATGVVGAAAVEAFLSRGDRVLALSRRAPLVHHENLTHLALDLSDASACDAAAHRFEPVTHLVYAALYEKPGLIKGWQEPDQMAANQRMLRHLLDPLLERAGGFQQLLLLQGTKAYGAHVHAIEVPAREDQVRDPHDNFYWLQEDEVRARQAGQPWWFTILRPQVVFGYAPGSAMNLIAALGAYASLCRELGTPFAFPGGAHPIQEAVDADLLGRVMVWAAESRVARGEIFNVTNGDLFQWRSLWPWLAARFGFEPAAPAPLSLAAWLPTQAPLWSAIAAREGLRTQALDALLGESHHYADVLFGFGLRNPPPPALVSTIKLRQAGFGECLDTRHMFERLFREAARRRLLPALLVE